MSIFIIGKNGYIAKRILPELTSKYQVTCTSSQPQTEDLFLDLAQPDNFDFNVIKEKDLIILLASISSPDICQNKYDFAYNINVKGTKQFIGKCIDKGARVLFTSSDTVYGLSDSYVDENSLCSPLGNYAQMKNTVEKEFFGQKNFKSFRFSYVFSKNDKFTSYINDCAQKDRTAEVFHPIYRSVVYINDIIAAMIAIYQQWNQWDNQIFNICGLDLLSRVDMANLYKEHVSSKLDFTVTEPEADFFKARPKVIDMRSLYLAKLINREPTKFVDALKTEFQIKQGDENFE